MIRYLKRRIMGSYRKDMNTNYEKLSKKAIGCMVVNEVIVGVVCTFLTGVAKVLLADVEFPFSLNWLWGIVAVIWVFCIVSPFVRYQRYRYRFTEEEIDMREGFLFVHRDIVPIERLHKIALESGPVDRIFGLTKVIVTTAGGAVVIRFLRIEQAEQIVEKLKHRINQYAIDKREKEMQA